MSGTEQSKAELSEEQRKSQIANEMEAEMEGRDESRQDRERSESEDLNAGGLQTGTYDSAHSGIHWTPSYKGRKKASKVNPDPGDIKKGA